MAETEGSFIDEALVSNSRIFSLPRLLILGGLLKYGLDGATFVELRAGLKLPDGVLSANLKALKNMGYLKSQKTGMGKRRKQTAYNITEEGKGALVTAKDLLKKWVREVEKNGTIGQIDRVPSRDGV